MAEAWQTDIGVNLALQRLLEGRLQELSQISEVTIDAALSSDDPLAGLRVLALADKEREVLRLAIGRVLNIQRDIKADQRIRERNLRKRW